jgi:hypothetical protein
MSLWGNLDAANNAPKSSATAGYGGNTPQVTANAQVYYANTRPNSFIASAAIGVFGVDAAEQANVTAATGKTQHAGWNVRKAGMGPIVSITANTGAVGSNSTITFANGGTPNTPASALVAVNAAGFITSVTVVNGGQYLTTPTANTMSNAVFTITMGGRANRVQTETLVAMGSMIGDGDTTF